MDIACDLWFSRLQIIFSLDLLHDCGSSWSDVNDLISAKCYYMFLVYLC